PTRANSSIPLGRLASWLSALDSHRGAVVTNLFGLIAIVSGSGRRNEPQLNSRDELRPYLLPRPPADHRSNRSQAVLPRPQRSLAFAAGAGSMLSSVAAASFRIPGSGSFSRGIRTSITRLSPGRSRHNDCATPKRTQESLSLSAAVSAG